MYNYIVNISFYLTMDDRTESAMNQRAGSTGRGETARNAKFDRECQTFVV